MPLREQAEPMHIGRKYLVKVLFDEESDRVFASSRLNRFIADTVEDINFSEGDAVQICIAAVTDLGYRAIVNNRYWGVLYENEVFKRLNIGEKMEAFIKNIRSDNKIDLSLSPQGYQKRISSETDIILDALKKHNGVLEITDKSSPELIYKTLNISKKSFKQAVGNLYKARKIALEEKCIRLL